MRDEGDEWGSRRYYSCDTCKAENSIVVRRSWQCGYVPRADRGPDKPRVPDGAPEDVTVCPGYSTTLPEVLEAARALSWRHDGLIGEFFGGAPISERAKIYIDILDTQIREVERHAFRVARKPKKGG